MANDINVNGIEKGLTLRGVQDSFEKIKAQSEIYNKLVNDYAKIKGIPVEKLKKLLAENPEVEKGLRKFFDDCWNRDRVNEANKTQDRE